MKSQFHRLHNENLVKGVGLNHTPLPKDILYPLYHVSDVKNALRKMRIVKLVGPKDIPTKV